MKAVTELTKLKAIENKLFDQMLTYYREKEFVKIRSAYYRANYNVWFYKNSVKRINQLEKKVMITEMTRSFVMAS